MKRIISIILSVVMTAALFLALPVLADDSEITVELDGVKIDFDVNSKVIDGRTMVPLRKIFEEIGALVKWDSDTQTVSARKNSKTITLAVDSNVLNIDSGKIDDEGNPITETVALEVPAQIVDERTLVPVRAISESFDLNVDWDEANNKVVITSDDTEDDSWKENTGTINLTDLTFDGNGIEITGNQINISSGGDFTLTGVLADGNITISAKEKVKLRLSGASITSSENPCIFAQEADKVYITLTSGTVNTLTAQNSEDGAIYSKENLEIKGDGALSISSLAGHGIKASDNLTIENGDITINAASDGIHINDTFKMSGGNINITADGDGIDSESIVIISGGEINIETNGTPISQSSSSLNTENSENTSKNINRFPMAENETEVEFEKSSKGINAEWMMCISGGKIIVNSASHALHCEDEIEINGGTIKATNPTGSFSGAFAVIDPDGQATISEKATLIFALGSGNERNLKLSQNTIIVYCEETHNANERISVSDADGNIIYDYTPLGKFGAVLISSENLILGKIYTITIGEEKYETEISGQSTVIGTQTTANKGFGREQIMH